MNAIDIRNLTKKYRGRAALDEVPADALGLTVVAVRRDGELLGTIAVADTVKPTSAAAIARLRRLGIRPILLTGDNAQTAALVGSKELAPTVFCVSSICSPAPGRPRRPDQQSPGFPRPAR